MAVCPDNELKVLMTIQEETSAARELDALLAKYSDPRLLFLKGSRLAAKQKYADARRAMRQALDLAPNYAIARFQLGLLELTSGAAYAALEIWGPLLMLPATDPLREFVEGLIHLVRDEFDAAITCLERGISYNRDNEPLSHNMEMIVQEIRKRPSRAVGSATSTVGQLLQQAALKTRH